MFPQATVASPRRLLGRCAVLVVHFDYPSAAATVAVLRLQALSDEGAPVAFSGLDLVGIDAAIPPTIDQLEEYERYRGRAAALGLPLSRPTRRPATLSAHVVGDAADDAGLGTSWRSACLRAHWQDGLDLGDPDVLVGLATPAGLSAELVAGSIADPAARARTRRRILDARRRGVGGVPVLDVDGTLVSAERSDAELRELLRATLPPGPRH